jgi:ubiquitin-like protein ATG12
MSSPIPRESSPASPGGTGVAPIPDQKLDADLPMTMTASVILTSLPGDAKKALEKASQAGDGGAPVKGMLKQIS